MLTYPISKNKITEIIKFSPIPLYYQLKEILRDEILNENLKPGERIPSERVLCEIYKVSKITVQKALKELENEGLIYKIRGAGTFVSQKKIKRQLGILIGFAEDMQASGYDVEREILKSEIQKPSQTEIKNLRLENNDLVVSIIRLVKIQGEPIAIFKSAYPEKYLRDLLNYDIRTYSIGHDLICNKFGYKLQYAEQWLEVSMADAYESQVLGIKEGSPIILTKRLTYTEDKLPIEYIRSIFRGDRIQFHWTLHK